jgi:hypothetical protein
MPKLFPLAALLMLAACASTSPPQPQQAAPMPVADPKYQQMSCAELDAAARNAASDIAWAREQQRETFSGGAPTNVTMSFPIGGSGGGGGDSGGPRVSSLKREKAELNAAMEAKGCG